MQRKNFLDRLQSRDERFDVLIIGGGASGLGAAVDASSRGYRVALIEQNDFAKATSSRSTKLVHGGVRYLKQGDVSLVRSALRERGLLLRNAPHLTRSTPFIIPGYSWLDKPFYGFGLTVYERLSGKLSLGKSRVLSRDEVVRHIPTVEQHGLRGGVLYYDGQFDDARLAINRAQTAAAHGAALANYCACTGLLKENGKTCGAVARDVETGDEFPVRARVVINATGVFVDDIRRFDDPGTKPLVAPSQGIHIVLPKKFLPGASALMVPKTADGRVLFAIPWKDRVVVGTTDTPVHTESLEPRALPEELSFVMEHAQKYLALDPTVDDVLSVFAGLRPLVKHGDSGNTAALSRDHTIVISKSGLVTLTGGKWTSYRKMAEDVIDHAESTAGIGHKPCVTTTLRILGADDAGNVDRLAIAEPALAEIVHPAFPEMRRADVIWQARNEMARTVEDVLARRTRSLLLDARASCAAAPAVAALLAAELGRDAAWAGAQTRDYVALAHGWLMPGARPPEISSQQPPPAAA
jgi:glycerol-3-phosphate dehydrogenase